MARRRRRTWLDAGLEWYGKIPPETKEAWDDYDAARRDSIFTALHDAFVYPENEDNAAYAAMRDRLVELGLDRHIGRVMEFIKAKRDNEQLPF